MKHFILLFFLLPFVSNAQDKSSIDTLKINCDSIYTKKGYNILHITYDKEVQDGYSDEKNSVFIFRKMENGIIKEIYRDTIFSRVQEINFEDYNNDKVKDILVQNVSDVRSNYTYLLYIVNPTNYTLTKIKGFEEIKNPFYNSEYKIVEGHAVSGENWTAFYKILKNHIYDYNIVIYDEDEETGLNTYDKDYDKAIKKILKKNKTLFKK